MESEIGYQGYIDQKGAGGRMQAKAQSKMLLVTPSSQSREKSVSQCPITERQISSPIDGMYIHK